MEQLTLPFLIEDRCELLDASQKKKELIPDYPDAFSFPPPFSIRKTARAKRMGLQVSPERGLVVIVPARLRFPRIESFLNEHRAWIEKNTDIILKHQTRRNTEIRLPTRLVFKAINKTIILEYSSGLNDSTSDPDSYPNSDPNSDPSTDFNTHLSTDLTSGTLETSETQSLPNSLYKRIRLQAVSENLYQILGPIHNKTLVLRYLKQFVAHQAKSELLPWLHALSLECGLPYTSAIIRRQATLWGSCNAAGKISLNTKLLFLEPKLTRYVMLHELCHTRHLNHSARFWNLLQKFDPEAKLHRKQLSSSDLQIPTWL
jgi:predicted metal-dependent hydrolase